MACACHTMEQISYLKSKYGTEGKKQKTTNIRGKIKAFFLKILYVIIMIPFIPFSIIYSLINRKKPINVGKMFGLSHVGV